MPGARQGWGQRWWAAAAMTMAAVLGTQAATPTAAACTPPMPAPLTAFPASGATEVSPQSSIIVVAAAAAQLAGLTLEAGGVPVPLPAAVPLGAGLLGANRATFHRFAGPLAPSTTYVLRASQPGAPGPELTRFTTAAASDTIPGVAPQINRLRLWRVRYPLAEIGAGGCVFDEYHGYIDVEYTDGTVPGTPAAELVGVLTLVPMNGASSQSFVFAGGRFQGLGVSPVPAGPPHPAAASWRPDLAPDRQYCLTMVLHGRNDGAIAVPRSNTVCAPVTSVDLTLPPDARDAGADAPDDLGSQPLSDAGQDSIGALASPTDAEQRDGGLPAAKQGRSGCSLSGAEDPSPLFIAPVAVLLLVRARRARRRG